MNPATVGSTCRSLFDGLRRLAAASALLVGAGCAPYVDGSSAINSIFDDATRLPTTYLDSDSEWRLELLLERDFPAGTATAKLVDYVIGAGGECMENGISDSAEDVEIHVCTHESFSYGLFGISNAVAYYEVFNKWILFMRSIDESISHIDARIQVEVNRLEESEYEERLESQNASESSQ